MVMTLTLTCKPTLTISFLFILLLYYLFLDYLHVFELFSNLLYTPEHLGLHKVLDDGLAMRAVPSFLILLIL